METVVVRTTGFACAVFYIFVQHNSRHVSWVTMVTVEYFFITSYNTQVKLPVRFWLK